MTQENSLLEFLKAQKNEDVAQGQKAQATREEWLTALKELYVQLRAWLENARVAGLAEIVERQVMLSEQHLGSYKAPALDLKMGSRVIHVVPRGRLIIGARGRVDLECGPAKAMLVRNDDGTWKFAVPRGTPGKWAKADLSDETFSQAIRGLLK